MLVACSSSASSVPVLVEAACVSVCRTNAAAILTRLWVCVHLLVFCFLCGVCVASVRRVQGVSAFARLLDWPAAQCLLRVVVAARRVCRC